MASFFHIPSRYPDHMTYWNVLSNHIIRYRHYEPREDYLENWSYFAVKIVEESSDLDLVPFFEDFRYPIQNFSYGFFKRFLELIPPNFVFDFIRTNKMIFEYFKNLRGIPTRSIQFRLQEVNFQDFGISEENGEISFVIHGDPYGYPDFIEKEVLEELKISCFLHVEADGYDDESIVEILRKLPPVYPDFTYEGCEDLDLVLDLVHKDVKFFKLRASLGSFEIDKFLKKTVNLKSLFVEIEATDDFATNFIMEKLHNWKNEAKKLENFYLGLADEMNFRRFYLVDDEIKCFEDEFSEDFEFESDSEED